MARALAIETSGRIGSIAAVLDGQVVGEESFAHGLAHAAQIIPIIDRLCRARSWAPRDVQELYVSAGPGSFTGLRIAITLAKMLALATGAKLVAVPTVRVLADNAPADAANVIIVLDAKREQIFTARFRAAAGPQAARGMQELRWIEEEGAHLDDLASMLARAPRPVHLLGEGIAYHRKFIPVDDAGVIVAAEQTWQARAAAVARIGTELARGGGFVDPLAFTPIYIRRPEAEEKWESMSRTAESRS